MSTRAAVLILEHQHPQRLSVLLASLAHPDIDLYVHIDARVPREPFERAASPGPQLTYLTDADRVPVTWGDLSVVEASLALLRVCLDARADYGRVALLSGADLRIAPLDEILAAWSTPAEFMRIDRALSGAGVQPNWRVRRRHLQTGALAGRLSGRLPRTVDHTLDLYQGSQWWALTADAARYVREFVDAHPAWMRFHRHTFGPDEIVIQSIVANSPYAAAITQDYVAIAQNHAGTDPDSQPQDHLHGMHYIDWSDIAASSPRVLSVDDLPTLRRSAAFFARKIGPDSTDLVTAFDQDQWSR